MQSNIVRNSSTGEEEEVPGYEVYNHHYSAFIKGVMRAFFGTGFSTDFALEDAIGSHACSLEALAFVQPMPFVSAICSSYQLPL
jgi:hypothetical protein